MKNKNLLITICIVGILVVLLIVCCFVGGDKSLNSKSSELSNDPEVIMSNAELESNSVNDNEKKEFTEINMDKYLEYFDTDDNNLVLIARPTCHYCQIAEPIIQNIAYEYDIDIDYLNTDNFEGDDQANFVASDELFKEGFGTPTFVVIGSGKITDSVDGLTDRAHYIDFLKKNGYIE